MSTNFVYFTNIWTILPSSQHLRLHQLGLSHSFQFSNKLFLNATRTNIPLHNNKFCTRRSLQMYAVSNADNYPYKDDKDSTELEQARETELEQARKTEFEQAREAVSKFLQDFGVSKEESVEIASNSPKYVEMLMDGVRELDELSLWNSWSSEGGQNVGGPAESGGLISFKEKVYHMAKKKGDKGILPLLESVGLRLSSAMHLGRYLASETLPNVIFKVKYMKEILFFSSDNRPIGKNARRMMMHLSIPIDEDVQQTLSFFQKIQARRGGLDMLDSGDMFFPYLIESFPRLLLLNVESKMMPIVEFLENIGVPKGYMRTIMLLFPPILFYNVEKDIKPRICAFKKVNLGDEDFGTMLVKYPWILSKSIQENIKEFLSFFDIHKVPRVCVEHAIKSWPHILGCSPSNLKLKVEVFDELGGIRDKKLGQVIAKSPQLLLQKPKEFHQVVNFLADLGLDLELVGQILGRCPEIFCTGIDSVLKKKIEFLVKMGIPTKHFPRIIRKYPDFLVCDIDKTLRPRMEYLMRNGPLSKREVGIMVVKFPPILGYSIEEVSRPKLEFLVNTMGLHVSDVVQYPRFLSYSLEKRIKPRFWILKSQNLKCNLKEMLAKNDDEFASDFILQTPVKAE